jgi:hypothetical protein
LESLLVLVSELSKSSLPSTITIPELLQFLKEDEQVQIHKDITSETLFSTDKNIQRFVLSLAEHYKPKTVVGSQKDPRKSSENGKKVETSRNRVNDESGKNGTSSLNGKKSDKNQEFMSKHRPKNHACDKCKLLEIQIKNNDRIFEEIEAEKLLLEKALISSESELADIKMTVNKLLPTLGVESGFESFSKELHSQNGICSVTSTPSPRNISRQTLLDKLKQQWQHILVLKEKEKVQNGSVGSVLSNFDHSEVFDSAIESFNQQMMTFFEAKTSEKYEKYENHEIIQENHGNSAQQYKLPLKNENFDPTRPNLPRANTTAFCNFHTVQQPLSSSCSSTTSSFLNNTRLGSHTRNSSNLNSPIGHHAGYSTMNNTPSTISSRLTPSASAGRINRSNRIDNFMQKNHTLGSNSDFRRSGSFDNRTKVVYYVNDDEYVTCIFKLPEDVVLSDFKRVFKPRVTKISENSNNCKKTYLSTPINRSMCYTMNHAKTVIQISCLNLLTHRI